ncbi:hypothetical protein VCHA38O209_50255 [Vibrio chagasii]|nr:hypothetical protein VCHA38O209_50255 [Vibrio chagasii]
MFFTHDLKAIAANPETVTEYRLKELVSLYNLAAESLGIKTVKRFPSLAKGQEKLLSVIEDLEFDVEPQQTQEPVVVLSHYSPVLPLSKKPRGRAAVQYRVEVNGELHFEGKWVNSLNKDFPKSKEGQKVTATVIAGQGSIPQMTWILGRGIEVV